MTEEIKPGAVVALTSKRGPEMTVVEIIDGICDVAWFNDKTLERASIRVEALVVTKPYSGAWVV